MIKIKSLHTYPVKSLKGIDLQYSKLSSKGLELDRNWMLVDSKGKFLSQRTIEKLSLFSVARTGTSLKVSVGNNSIDIPLNHNLANLNEVNIWDDTILAFDEDVQISNWFNDLLSSEIDEKIRLVRISDKNLRNIDKKYLQGEDAFAAFSDGFPFLVASNNSLQELNKRLVEKGEKEIPMNRFRPNIVIDGLEPFAENNIDYLEEKTGKYRLALRKPCMRCKIITIDQNSAKIENPKEPLKTLANDFPISGKHGAFFGQNVILINGEGENISVDDKLIANYKT